MYSQVDASPYLNNILSSTWVLTDIHQAPIKIYDKEEEYQTEQYIYIYWDDVKRINEGWRKQLWRKAYNDPRIGLRNNLNAHQTLYEE